MRTFRRMVILCLVCMLLVPFAACSAEQGEKTLLGIVDLADIAAVIEAINPGKYEVITFPTMSEVMAALRSGRVTVAQCTEDYARFMMKLDNSLAFTRSITQEVTLSMLARESDAELLAALNVAIETLSENGTLDALYEQYVTNASLDNVPDAPPVEVIDGAKTIVVGVSGDMPPHDYVTVDGNPAGYNVALMGEVAKLAGFNVKFMPVVLGTKFAALQSERIDLFFMHMGYTHFEGIVQTIAYADEVYLGHLSLQ